MEAFPESGKAVELENSVFFVYSKVKVVRGVDVEKKSCVQRNASRSGSFCLKI